MAARLAPSRSAAAVRVSSAVLGLGALIAVLVLVVSLSGILQGGGAGLKEVTTPRGETARLLGRGLYATMSLLAPDVRLLLARDIFDRSGARCRVGMIHDGTAAAAAFAGEPNAAIIALGSALGVGFPPERADHLLRIDDLQNTRYSL